MRAVPPLIPAPALPIEPPATPESPGIPGTTGYPEPHRSRERSPTVVTDPWAHRRAEPRPFALMWTGYLLLATAAALGPIAATHFLTPDVYRPAATVLMVSACLGVVVFWPMIRLSQEVPDRRVSRSVLLDMLAILVPLQATIWPQAIPALANWDVQVAGAIAVHSVAWLAATGGLLTIALLHARHSERSRGWTRGVRTAWMAGFVVLASAGWAVSVIVASSPPLVETVGPALWSPASAVMDMTSDRSWRGRPAVIVPEHWRAAALVGVFACAAWLWALGLEWVLGGAPRDRDGMPTKGGG